VIDLVYAPTADDDLLEIFLLIAEDDEIVADRFVDRIRTSVWRLAHYPLSAPARPELGSDIRSLVVGHYVVLHRATSEQVRILRILHGSRDLATALIGED